MVDALGRIHHLLRPDGVLLDVHPQPENIAVEVWRGGRMDQVGHVDQDSSDITDARARLELVERDGWFATKARRSFDLLMHFPGVDEWLEYRLQEDCSSVVSEDLITRARLLLSEEEGEVVIRESIRASLLKRLPGPG